MSTMRFDLPAHAKLRIITIIFFFLFFSFIPSFAQTPLATVEGIRAYQLPNGLKVLLAPDDSKPTTTVNMTYLVGSRHENYGETGMAHLLEHMLFKGSKNIPNALGEFSKRGLQANGSTWTDRTNYYASFAANPETLKWYLSWQADAMINARIARSDLDSEMTVVRNEMESGENNPFRVMMEKMLATAFQWHNYGKTTIGARSDVENVDTDRLKAFYRQYYQPDNAVLIVAGSFDPTTTLQHIQKVFGAIPKPTRQLPRLYTKEPVQDGERSVTIRRSGGSSLLGLLYHIPAAADPQFVAFDLLSILLSDDPTGRLHKEFVQPHLASSAYAFTFETFEPGVLLLGLEFADSQQMPALEQKLITSIETLAKRPFTQEELERARALWLQQWDNIFADPQRLGIALSESIATGDWRLFFIQRDRVKNMSLEELQAAINAYIVPDNRTLGRFIPTDKPQRAPESATVDIAQLVKGYQGNQDFVATAAFDTSPGNIQKNTQRDTWKIGDATIRLALLPKPSRGQKVSARLDFNFGSINDVKGQAAISAAVGSLLEQGTRQYTREQIADRFVQLKTQVSIAGGASGASIALNSDQENIVPAIEFALEVLRTVEFKQDHLEEYRQAQKTDLLNAKSQPEAIASRALARHMQTYSADDVRYVPTVEEELQALESLQLNRLTQFYEKMYGLSQVNISIVGSFNEASLKTSLRQSLEKWKAAPAFQRVLSGYTTIPAEQMVFDTPDKDNAFYTSGMRLALQDTSPDYLPLVLANFLFGGSETSRLWMRVREQDGLSYSVRSSLSASSFEANGSFGIYAIYAPQNKQKLLQAINEEWKKVIDTGFSEKEVQQGIEAYLNYRKLGRAQDKNLASVWNIYLETERDFLFAQASDERIKKLTAKEVNAAFQKYIQLDKMSSAIAGDFSKNP